MSVGRANIRKTSIAKTCALGAALFVAVMFTGMASPAFAGGFWWFHDDPRHAERYQLYRDVDYVAYLEANPDIDDAVKGSEITAVNIDIRHLRGVLGRPRRPWSWAFTPCCYSRKVLRIR